MDPEDFNTNQKKLFSELKTEEAPPEELEKRIIAALKDEKLLRAKRQNSRTHFRFLIAAALFAAVFAAGLIYGRTTAPRTGPSYTETTYIFFLESDSEFNSASNESEEIQRVNEYRNWAIDLRKQGINVSGIKLRDQATILDDADQRNLDTALVQGYFLIDAPTREKAIEIAKSCPHLKYGGKIELRQIHPV